jgi:hypothetical protein
MHLFVLEELSCPNCQTERFKVDTEGEKIDKRMKDFFFCANLEDIQKSYYQSGLKIDID